MKIPDQPAVYLYAIKIGLPLAESQKFFDYYESNGWRVGKNPMKSWEAAMRNWKRNYDEKRYCGSPSVNCERKLTPMDLKTIISAKETQAAALRNSHCCETAMSSTWNNDEAKRKFFTLKNEIKSLNSRLAAFA